MKSLLSLGVPAVAGVALVLSGLLAPASETAGDPAAGSTSAVTPQTPAPEPDAGENPDAAGANQGPAVDCAVLKCLALTFDDGPNEATTPRLLETLSREQVPATFFMQGASIAVHPDTVRQVADTPGMEIATHSATHPDLTGVTSERLTRELVEPADQIEEVTGERPTLMRPPYGSENEAVREAAGVAGQAVILWSIDTLDWQTRDAAATAETTLAEAEPGAIALMHDIHPSTVDAVPEIVQGLKDEGYTLVTVSELLGQPEPGVAYTDASEDPA